MARTKTTTSNPEDHTTPVACSQSPPPNVVVDHDSDQSPLNETPLYTFLSDVIIPASETPKTSKRKSSKKPIIKRKSNPTRRSQRMKTGSSKKPTVSHVDLVSHEEKKEDSSDDEMEEVSEEEEEEDYEQTLSEMIKSVKAYSKKGKKIAAPSPSEENSPSMKEDE